MMGGSNSSGDLKDTGEGPCDSADECKGGVCVAIIDNDYPPVYCTQECNSNSDCPDGFYCDTTTFQLVGLSFCRYGTPPATGEPDTPEEPPVIKCQTDEDCPPGGVCAVYQGERGCTIPCDTDQDCAVSMAGMEINLWKCEQEEGAERTVCLPDPECFTNPMNCYSF